MSLSNRIFGISAAVALALACTAYLVGIFSGYYAAHPAISSTNPDAWIHSALLYALMNGLAWLIAVWMERKAAK